MIPAEQEGGEGNYCLEGKGDFLHPENDILHRPLSTTPDRADHQLLPPRAADCMWEISRLSDKARSTFYVPTQLKRCLTTHSFFVQFPKPHTE